MAAEPTPMALLRSTSLGEEEETIQVSDDVILDLDRMNTAKIREGMYQTAITFAVALILLSMAYAYRPPVSLVVGLAYLAIFAFYLANILYLLCRAPQIYRVYSIYEIPTKWVSMPVASENREYRQQPILSISEFSAIAGGAAHLLLARLGSYAFAIIMTFVCTEFSRTEFQCPLSLFLECVGAFGVVVLGTFYLDPYSTGMRNGHNTGLGLSCCTLLGFLLQRIDENEHIWIAVLLIAVFIIFFLLFWFYPSHPSSDPNKVTMISLRQIGFEAVALAMLTSAAGLYFIMYTF